MSDINILIKVATFDIISVITVWGFFNNYTNMNIYFNNKIYPININFFSLGISTYILRKYI
jgi:hypothetical protein